MNKLIELFETDGFCTIILVFGVITLLGWGGTCINNKIQLDEQYQRENPTIQIPLSTFEKLTTPSE